MVEKDEKWFIRVRWERRCEQSLYNRQCMQCMFHQISSLLSLAGSLRLREYQGHGRQHIHTCTFGGKNHREEPVLQEGRLADCCILGFSAWTFWVFNFGVSVLMAISRVFRTNPQILGWSENRWNAKDLGSAQNVGTRVSQSISWCGQHQGLFDLYGTWWCLGSQRLCCLNEKKRWRTGEQRSCQSHLQNCSNSNMFKDGRWCRSFRFRNKSLQLIVIGLKMRSGYLVSTVYK